MKKVLVPRVRFKGFSEEWKEERLENIYSFASEGGTPDTNKDIYYKPGLFYFTKIEDMANKYISHTKSKISELGLKNSSAWIIPRNNILFSNGATIGNVSINKVDLSTKQGIVGMIIKKKFNLEFICYLLKSENFQSKVAEKITVGTIPTVAIFNLKKIELFLSKNIYEQQKIGKLLENIDNLITIEQSKLNKLKQLKETLLQKMFPEGNSKTPRIRFKGFSKEWKEEKLEYIAKVTNGKSNTSDNNKWGQYNLYIRSEEIYKSNKYIFDVEGVITVGDGNIGKIFHYVNGKFDLHQRCYLIYEFQNIWPKYFYYYFSQNFYKRAILMSYTATVNSIRMNTITDMDIMFPKELIEQQKIGDFFSYIDTLINLYQSKLNKLKQIKEALLQKLLI
ncbi:restriction endonuclease subunit S [Mycoplasmopsis felis]|uniref:restriction endonuclease subunit S n=1 Tax=Mycoplasmopsis felis TaxID=33923 RepID=UPI002AFED587|nr:restriction endonuclease subunit S [Mycoplasmopsis felis]WQQ05123.1 restriction endonuclease subunit S [Mycoplasmopsis felis]